MATTAVAKKNGWEVLGAMIDVLGGRRRRGVMYDVMRMLTS